MNKFIGIGRVTKDIELMATPSGAQYVRFDIAIDNGKDKDGNKRDADFVSCVAWDTQNRKLAETLSVYVKKGHRICVEGKVKTDKYQNDNGENRYRTYILVHNFVFLESKPKNNYQPQEPDYVQTNQTKLSTEDIDNIPLENDPFAEVEINQNDLPF